MFVVAEGAIGCLCVVYWIDLYMYVCISFGENGIARALEFGILAIFLG